ncbi:metalloregulator ArsR/SmtB family transcription factor [Luteococcus peritonei]
MDALLAALAHPARQALLDALRERDGQSLTELGLAVPDLGRHAVLKHVAVLEAAQLVTTTKSGRTRHCYLNPTPLVALARRWLDDYALGWGSALVELRTTAETKGLAMTPTNDQPLHRHSVIIDADPQRVWTALTQECASWYFGTTLNSSLKPGSEYTYTYPDGRIAAQGTIIAADPGQRLEMTFSPTWDEAVTKEPGFRLTWILEAQGAATLVTVEHHGLDPASETARQVGPGSLFLASNLKTWIETGHPMGR